MKDTPSKAEDSALLANELERELFKLINTYVSKGLEKPDLIRKLKWVLGSAEMS